MNTPSFLEDHISQIPAVQMLQKLGYEYLTPDEADRMRGGKTTNVLLEDVLRRKLHEINSIKVSAGRTSVFSDANIENGIRALKEFPMQEGYMAASEYVYNLLTLGKALEQSIDRDKKSFTLRYIDWENPENNVFHVTEEYSVMRSISKEHYRPDIVLHINGIPVCIIECKRPDMKDSISQAISQHLRNQQEDGIRQLYVYGQLLMSLSVNEAAYATNGTTEDYWSHWNEYTGNKEQDDAYHEKLYSLKNEILDRAKKEKLFSGRFHYVQSHFEALEAENILPTVQDQYLIDLCSPQRMMDLIHNFIVFDNGEKKIARYQQFFAIKKSMMRLLMAEEESRPGGVIWHTQGSGKSLTMVMLAQAIAMSKDAKDGETPIRNPKIILVTDRIDLDDQITETFRKCNIPVTNASTGQKLIELLQGKSDAVITTVINKFESAMKRMAEPLESKDIFVLVDEGHRTQHGTFNIEMQKTLPNACYIAFTGTPLFKKDKSTAQRFGGIIDSYTVDQAVKDKAVVPLLYEGRYAKQVVSENPIDNYFNLISEPLNDYQKADLKKKYTRADQLNEAEQKIYANCWDISLHFRDNFQGLTPFKGQLVTPSKMAAVRYKKFLDEINIVSSEVLISPPDDREGEDSSYEESSDLVKSFWKRMMAEHGTAEKYQKNIINRFKKAEKPEIIIVVDKLLTGFDEPKNTVLYLTRNLQGHALLQAIARVNRVYPDKDFGYIIDYYGVLKHLGEALDLYSSFQDFDAQDVEHALLDIYEEIRKLPQRHAEVWQIFKTIKNTRDPEPYQVLLADVAVRVIFYDKLSAFARTLKIALSSIEFHRNTEAEKIERYKNDLAFFMKLRNAVAQRYSDTVDYKQYEGQIQKLIDKYVQSDGVEVITNLVNIFDKEAFQLELDHTEGTRAKADKIASRTAKHISEKMQEDPAFYKKFSELLKDAIREFEEKRIAEAEYFNRVKEIMEAVLSRTDADLPDALKTREVGRAFYGILREELGGLQAGKDILPEPAMVDAAMAIDDIIQGLMKVNWQNEIDIPKKMVLLIGDYLIDEVRDKYNLALSFEIIDRIAAACVEVAKIRYRK